MDPVTIVGVISSVVQIVDVVTKSIAKLSELKSKYRNAPLHISTLIGQLYITQAALNELQTWRSQSLASQPRYQQLAGQIDNSLASFSPLLLALEQELDNLGIASPSDTSPTTKLSFIWNENALSQYLNLLDRQVNALNLFLQAIQCRNLSEQQILMTDEDNQDVLRSARDCSSSLLALNDRASIHTENTNALSLEFDFDRLILGSRVYQTAYRSHLERAIVADRRLQSPLEQQTGSHRRSTTTEVSESVHNTSQAHDLVPHAIVTQVLNPLTAPVVGRDSPEGGAQSMQRPNALQEEWRPYVMTPQSAEHVNQPQDTLIIDSRQIGTCVKPAIQTLLLGACDTGKSTLLKRLFMRLNGSHSPDTRLLFREIIYSNVIQGTRAVLETMEAFEIPLQNFTNEMEYHVQTIFMQPLQVEGPMHPEVGLAIKSLWSEAGFLECYRRRFEYQLFGCEKNYARDISRLAREDYVPSHQDVLLSRVKTTGVTETTFDARDTRYALKVHDVGGTRFERKNWIHAFKVLYASKDATVVIFCVDVAAYAKLLFEDESINRMSEQFTLFESIANSRWFLRSSFILLFTKMDTLVETMSIKPIPSMFDDFEEKDHESQKNLQDRYLKYITKRFLDLVVDKKRRQDIKVLYANLTQLTTMTWEDDPIDEIINILNSKVPTQ